MRRFVSTTLLVLFALVASQSAQAQTFTVIHRFLGEDGASPFAGLTMDGSGRLYGTTVGGGASGHGTVFRLRRSGSSWVLAPLYSFAGGNDGADPQSRVVFGPDGSLYGTTVQGGSSGCGGEGCGTVFGLRPPSTACKAALCPWTETILHAFSGVSDGGQPLGDLIFDDAGNPYGTTPIGGGYGAGNVYQLTPSGGGWTENNLYGFLRFGTLQLPFAGVTRDKAGNLYGTAVGGDYGGVFALTPSGSSWVYNQVYVLQGGVEGGVPRAGLIVDEAGNLYSATASYGAGGGGTVFELMPSNDGWGFSVLYSFVGVCCNEVGPWATLVMDAAGNLYGTTFGDGAYGLGSVFELSPGPSGWTYTSLHDFTGGNDGANPVSNVIFDASGNLYGTASTGAQKYNCPNGNGCGVVWEITP